MRYRLLALMLLFVLLGLVSLLGLQWRFRLGPFEQNPQQLDVTLGWRMIVGGGRAVLGFADVVGEVATLELSCYDQRQRFKLLPGQTSDEICGIRVELIGVNGPKIAEAPPRAEVRVWWEP